MEGQPKGTVTSLSSIFSSEEAQKASQRVHDAIAERHKQLDQVREFIADNTNLINLVQRLPDDLHHDIMVPFGKAAFFPGRLIHTNEFLVLLGEGYYAERTSKQTIEVLTRRGKVLESQVESIKALVQDLEAEASFFDATASEAEEGLVEIREEYSEENITEKMPETGLLKPEPLRPDVNNYDEEEFADLISRLDELEKQELEAENDEDIEQDEKDARPISSLVELNKQGFSRESVKKMDENDHNEAYYGEFLRGNSSTSDANNRYSTEKTMMFPEVKDEPQVKPRLKHKVPSEKSEQEADSLKAFTCSIVEHTHNLPTNPNEASFQRPSSQSSKPVSKFKMQRK